MCLTLSAISAAGAKAQTPTFTMSSYPLLGNSHVAADFNGDGRPDLAGTGASPSGAPSAAVIINNGDGTFRPEVDYPVVDYHEDLAAGDFNGDGRIDLVVTINSPVINLSLLTGNGDGTFNAPVNFPNTSGLDSPSIVAEDLNNDGKLDVAIMHSLACYNAPCVAATTMSVMLGNGDGTFQPARELPAGRYMSYMTSGDFNRDGIKDLAIGSEDTELQILLGVGDGTFTKLPAVNLISALMVGSCGDIDVADFNRDAIPDLAVAIGNGNGNVILLGNGDGTFRQSSQITYNATQAPHRLAVADYNADGFLDIARAMGYGNLGWMEIANGNGDGTFQTPVAYLKPTTVNSTGAIYITSSDFNGDAKPDIALAVGGAGDSLNILLNSTGATTTTAPVTVSSLTLNPSAVTGGSASTATLSLSARVQTATTVRLTSSNAAATVPASVTVAAGASSASFTVGTTQVTAQRTATLTATLNNTSRSANLTINPPASTADTVSVTRAEYETAKRTLRVEATCSRSTATLQVFVTSTNQLVGTLTNNGGGKYSGQFNLTSNPQSITVRSNGGGQTTRTVTVK